MQFWPAAQNAPDTHDSTAQSRSASRQTMTGELEPSSMPIFFRPASLVTRSPASTPPVNEIMRTRGSATSGSPISVPKPVIVCSTLGGRPASTNASVSLSADSGVTVAGLRTTALPAATAGPSLWATRLSGSLNGVIASTTPIGTRS